MSLGAIFPSLVSNLGSRLCCTSATSKAFPDINFNPSQPPNKPARAINRRRGESQAAAARRRLLIKFATRQSWFCARNLRRRKILPIVVRGLIYLSRLYGSWCAVRASGVWRVVLVQVAAAPITANLLSMFDFHLIRGLCALSFGIDDGRPINLHQVCQINFPAHLSS
jgi:hypothetical protein